MSIKSRNKSNTSFDFDEEDRRAIKGVKFENENDKKKFKRLRDQMRRSKYKEDDDQY